MRPLLEQLQREPWRKWIAWVFAALSVGMLAYRFVGLDLAPFIMDEPQFLQAAWEQVRTGEWVSHSPLRGSVGMHYGPSVLWLYGAVQWMFGRDPLVCIAVICLLVTASQLALTASLARAFGGGVFLFAVLTALVASSPYQFFWSRLAWDPLVSVCAAGIVALLAHAGPAGFKRALAIGALAGVAASSHPMALPFLALALLVLALQCPRSLRGLAVLASSLAVAVVINVPYLLYVLRTDAKVTEPTPFAWDALKEHAVLPAQVASYWKMSYFFDGQWPAFETWAQQLGAPVHHGEWIAAGLGVLAGLGLLAGSVLAPPRGRVLCRMGAAAWAGYVVLFALRMLLRQPHYTFAYWWVIPAGVAGALAVLRRFSPRAAVGLGCALLIVAAVQFQFIRSWMKWTQGREGTRGIHYGPVLANQRAVMEQVCRRPEARLQVAIEARVFPYSLAYFAGALPACEGKSLSFCRFRCSPEAGAAHLAIGYANPDTAELVPR